MKKVLSLLLAMLMIVGILAGCGEAPEMPTTPAQTGTASGTPAAPEESLRYPVCS